jgi:nicotinamidase-related amidase
MSRFPNSPLWPGQIGMGFNVYVVSDATATFDRVGHNGKMYKAEDVHEFALASLNEEFAIIIKTEELIKSLE